LAELADLIPMDNDSFETVLFYAADGLIRTGGDPEKFVRKLEARGLGAASYLRGSFAYHRLRNPGEAIKHLSVAFKKRVFTSRTATLLAKAYYEHGDATKALGMFEELGADHVRRNSGMLAQMIRCLRVAGRRADADRLSKELSRVSDEHGDYEMMQAATLFRQRQLGKALEWVERAKLKSRVDRVNLALLEASIMVENQDFSAVEEAINLAIGVGRNDDAQNLRARVALHKPGGWREAEDHLNKIPNPNYFDKVLLLRALMLKVDDPAIKADPTLSPDIRRRIEALTVDIKGTVEEFGR
jgi:tetratricopeptide (TPR) repeat protein